MSAASSSSSSTAPTAGRLCTYQSEEIARKNAVSEQGCTSRRDGAGRWSFDIDVHSPSAMRSEHCIAFRLRADLTLTLRFVLDSDGTMQIRPEMDARTINQAIVARLYQRTATDLPIVHLICPTPQNPLRKPVEYLCPPSLWFKVADTMSVNSVWCLDLAFVTDFLPSIDSAPLKSSVCAPPATPFVTHILSAMDDASYSDIKVVTDDGDEISAHRVILAQSPFWKSAMEWPTEAAPAVVATDATMAVVTPRMIGARALVESYRHRHNDKDAKRALPTHCSTWVYRHWSKAMVADPDAALASPLWPIDPEIPEERFQRWLDLYETARYYQTERVVDAVVRIIVRVATPYRVMQLSAVAVKAPRHPTLDRTVERLLASGAATVREQLYACLAAPSAATPVVGGKRPRSLDPLDDAKEGAKRTCRTHTPDNAAPASLASASALASAPAASSDDDAAADDDALRAMHRLITGRFP